MGTKLSQAVAETVQRAMAGRGLSLLGLEDATGISRATLRRRLAGSPFTTDELAAVARVLDTTPSAIVSAAEQVDERPPAEPAGPPGARWAS